MDERQLLSIAVDPVELRFGVGNGVFSPLCDWFRSCGAEDFGIIAAKTQTAALYFYRRRGATEVAAELALEHLVVTAGLLLLAQLHAVLGLPHATAAMLAGRIGAALDAALVGEAALALEEELLALAAALLALGGGIAGH